MNNPNLSTIWKSIQSELQTTVPYSSFKGLVGPLKLHDSQDGQIILTAQNDFLARQAETKHGSQIKQLFEKHLQQAVKLTFTVNSSPKISSTDTAGLPLFEKSPELNLTPDHPSSPLSPKSYILNPTSSQLNPTFTFSTFAVGSTNQLAFAAAEAVAKQPSTAYNPLFIWGDTGVGKSHLMQAIGHSILKNQPQTKIICCPGEDFTNEIIAAIRNKTTMKFKQKYRHIDILLLDDIQFLAGKDTAQEEFFHTFNAIQRAGGQIVMTGDRPPSELTRLEDRLRSRFQAGLIVDIAQPDFELRTAILLIKSKQRGFELPMDLAQSIAETLTSARELEGFLMTLQASLFQQQRQLDHQLVAELLGKATQEAALRRGLRPQEVLKVVADYYNLKITQLKSPARQARIVLPRQIAIYILRKDLNIPLEAVGALLNRDHTTVMHSVEKIDTSLGKTPGLLQQITGIRELLR